MRILIVGGGIAAAYLANAIKKHDVQHDVMILSDEHYPPYDRIHLCSLVNKQAGIDEVKLPLDPTIRVELDQKIIRIDNEHRRVFSEDSMFGYDKLIIATGSVPVSLFDISGISNASVFRSVGDCQKIGKSGGFKNIVIVGAGPVALELLETLEAYSLAEKITLLVRSKYLYDSYLSTDTVKLIEECYTQKGKITVSYEDEIVDYQVKEGVITHLKTKKHEFEDLFLVFGIGIRPNIEFATESLACKKGILVDRFMRSISDENIYAVGECAEVDELGFIAGHVKECTRQADAAIANLLGLEDAQPFEEEVTIDMLKVGSFDLVEVRSPKFDADFEKVVIASAEDQRIDEYFLKENRLVRFVGLNTNADVGYLQSLIQSGDIVDVNYFYQNRLVGERGRLVCSCEHVYSQDIVDIVTASGVGSFSEFGAFSQAGRVCGRCKKMVEDIIRNSQSLIDPDMLRKTPEEIEREKEIAKVQKRIDKFNKLHPRNDLSTDNLDAAMKSLDISKHEVNSWISMVTASMQLHPNFEESVDAGVKALNKVPIIWLELADCSGNSEAFIKSVNPAIEELIFDYISLDYHELLMSPSGDQSESVLEEIIQKQKGEYVLLVEGAVPLGLEGKFLRIGPKGETGLELLRKCAKDAALVIAVGSCAFDGGVVAAAPNPTGAVGVAQALGRSDVINISGCPTNPVNIVGTLLSYLMFEELPPLDRFNRPLWAYEGRVHDNCERRGHYELGEFVKEWGDAGAKKGWCLFEMGCKGPYTNANCPTMKFNLGTSWPVQAGHGCMGCVEAGFFDKYANERKYEEPKEQ